MKQYMKRVVLVLCMAACLFSLSACSSSDAGSDINPTIQMQLEQLPASFLQTYVALPDEQAQEFKEQMELQDQYKGLAEGVDSWLNVKDDLGALVSIGDTVEVEAIDGGYSATINGVFEKRNMEFGITTDRNVTKITGVSFVPEYTLGENMTQAFWHTVIGMGTVFVVLILISLIISCFKFINQAEARFKKTEEPGTEPAQEFVPAAEEEIEEEELSDDLELVAVITAAIAASTGANPSGLVVRSIRRAPGAKWKKG